MTREQSGWYVACGALLLAQLSIGLFGIQRGLWLDEAWVGNSVMAPTLGGMFYYPEWLQTSPPVFLLLVRAAVSTFGLSEAALRVVPLGLALIGLCALLAAARRVLSPGFSLLTGAIAAFDSVTIEYSHSLKQYSGEWAATCIALWLTVRYVQDPKPRQAIVLIAAVSLLLLPLSYAVIFLLPASAWLLGVVHGRRSAILFAISTAIATLLLYMAFVRPNQTPQLFEFWRFSQEAVLRPGTVAQLVTVIAATAYVGQKLWRQPLDERAMIQGWCLLPCLLLIVAGLLGWYPVTARTRLFLLPCYCVAVLMLIEDGVSRLGSTRWFEVAAVACTALVTLSGMLNQVREARDTPAENLAEAMTFLRAQVRPTDLVLVHASEREGFVLESAMHPWTGPAPKFGNTGWPCCPREKNALPGNSNEGEVRRELNQMVPADYSGRVWLFYTNRPSHWKYTGLDEGDAWRRLLWERGCPPDDLGGRSAIGLSLMDCRRLNRLPTGN